YEFTSQPGVVLRLHLLRRDGGEKTKETYLSVSDAKGWHDWVEGLRPHFSSELRDEPASSGAKEAPSYSALLETTNAQLVAFAPRGIGRSAWDGSPKKQAQIRRRFMLLGQTLESMQVWDIRRAMQALRSLPDAQGIPVTIVGSGESAAMALYASLFEPPVDRLVFTKLPRSHRDGPNFLNILRFLDMPQAVALAAERSPLVLFSRDSADLHLVPARSVAQFGVPQPPEWEYPIAVAKSLDWKPEQLQFQFDEIKPPADKK
ncbi:MAG TPA: hypothetical protein VIK18_05100, partial [Pirellulales bacterium]